MNGALINSRKFQMSSITAGWTVVYILLNWNPEYLVQSNLAITRVEGGRILKQKTAL